MTRINKYKKIMSQKIKYKNNFQKTLKDLTCINKYKKIMTQKIKYKNNFQKTLKDLTRINKYKKIMSIYNMEHLTKNELIKLNHDLSKKLEQMTRIADKLTAVLKKGSLYKKEETEEVVKPIPAPRKTVKQMVQEYEDNIIQPPLEFRDDYKPVPLPRTKKPVPLPRTKITQLNQALKGFTKSFEISINTPRKHYGLVKNNTD